MSPWGCFIGAIACPDEQGTYTIVEVDSAGGEGYQPTGRILATGVSHGELQTYAHVVTIDDERCAPPPPPTVGCPSHLVQQGEYCCEETHEISTTFDPQQPEGVCVATRTCYSPPDYTQIIGAPVEGGVDMSFCEAPPPPTEEEALACPTDGTFDLYDAVSGEHIASGVAEADLPAGAEIVADDDPRCGPAVPPALPGDGGLPGGPIPGPIPTQPGGPMLRPSSPTAPGAAPLPGTDPFARGFLPCGAQPPINLRVLKTQTLPSRPDSWQSDWAKL